MFRRAISITCITFLCFPALAFAADPQIDRAQLKELIREIVREELGITKSTAPDAATKPAPAAAVNATAATAAAMQTLDQKVEEKVKEAFATSSSGQGPFNFSFKGYGDMRFAYYDYPENEIQPDGARGESRASFDVTRFTTEFEALHVPSGIEIEAEVEFEHGGSGSAMELEAEEFGEFEHEVEKGGEVVLEELYVSKSFADGWNARAGRFHVNVGLLSDFHNPTDYFTTGRPEVEETILPGVWDEVGFEVSKEFDFGRAIVQVVNGLDSTGFGAERWVATGKQDRFEVNRAEDLAGVARLDITAIPDLLIGGSVYYGESSGNRPKDDLSGNGGVLIGDVHARYWKGPLRAQGAFIIGHLENADEISERNSRLPNALEVDRTPVSDGALGVWAEAGYDVAEFVGMSDDQRLEPFVHFDYYDTYYDTRSNLTDNGRYERTVYTAGIAYTLDNFFVTKIDYSIRDFGLGSLSSQDRLRLGIGFVY